MNRLAGKVATVTGGSVGIGRACVQRMAEEGAKVAIFDVLEAEGKALAEALEAEGHDVAFWPVDVADEAAVKSAIDAAAARFGGLHVLVNNAGISGSPSPTDQVTEAEWDRVQAVNVKGVFFGTKHAIPHMRAAGKGSIINLSSIAGLIGVGGIAPYHASKGAVRLMTKNDAITYAAEQIRVNSIHPPRLYLDADGGKPPACHRPRSGGRKGGGGGRAPHRHDGRTRRHRLGRGLAGLGRGEVRHRHRDRHRRRLYGAMIAC